MKVGEFLTPKESIAIQGDEVRWVNTTSALVDISFDHLWVISSPVKRDSCPQDGVICSDLQSLNSW